MLSWFHVLKIQLTTKQSFCTHRAYATWELSENKHVNSLTYKNINLSRFDNFGLKFFMAFIKRKR